ncbi:alpha/beta hydrolase [Adhaeribacter radiodurans]|uniref:Alpha/beta hydrolase n=1 Tax=Adhaeribacter radiodurans TaxID=2745197 RepID=A0A7L7L306_9BACT|nr:alpha/beta hydrolase [Adhaeribacter radiodurans]QMU27182.1 alpha/beta hydrolase [Adhaeribacter radiodurans]
MQKEQPQIYLIPGLGADARMFQFLQLDAEKFKIVILEWLSPYTNEPLAMYASRMAAQIKVNTQPIILVGVSFGGMIAVEISKFFSTAHVILISSIKTHTELPFYLRFFGQLEIHKYLPLHWAKKLPWFYNWVFGAKTIREKKLLNQIIQDTDISFVKWAFTAIANWQNQTRITNLVHLHGDQDKIFPLAYIKEPVVYPGTHLIIFSATNELSLFITQKANQIFY